MTGTEVLLDLCRANQRAINGLLEDMPAACAVWRPDAEANNINITVWHLARCADVLVNVLLTGGALADQIWHQKGWAERTGYDPDGVGYRGWGVLTGYTQVDVAEVPTLSTGDLLAYFNSVYDQLLGLLSRETPESLMGPCPGDEAGESRYYWYAMTTSDNLRHTGEMQHIESRWVRLDHGSAA